MAFDSVRTITSLSELGLDGITDQEAFQTAARYMVKTGNIVAAQGSKSLQAGLIVYSELLNQKFSDRVLNPEELTALGMVEKKLTAAIAGNQMDGTIQLIEAKQMSGVSPWSVPIMSLDEGARSKFLSSSEAPDMSTLIVPTTDGLPLEMAIKNGKPIQFSINGDHGSPKDMAPIVKYDPKNVSRNAVVYNEEDFRLAQITEETSYGIAAILSKAPANTPLIIDAYSMGTRIAAGVLVNLNDRGFLDRPVNVHLYGSTTPGYDAANLLSETLSMPFANEANVDMGSNTEYQKYINEGSLRLSQNRKISLTFIDAEADITVPGMKPEQWAGGPDEFRNNITHKVVTVHGADHLNMLDLAPDVAKDYSTTLDVEHSL